MNVTERTYTLQPKRGERVPHFFGRRLPAGTEVTVYEVTVAGRTWAFETAEEAQTFAAAEWPKPIRGDWLTSDGRRYPAAKKDLAEGRQARIGGAK